MLDHLYVFHCVLPEVHPQTLLPEEGKAESTREYGKNFCSGMIIRMIRVCEVYICLSQPAC